MIRLQTLGTLDLRNADGERFNAVLSQPKRLALLTYLAAETAREFHHRDTLTALFWPDLDDQHARMNLRKVLHLLRGSLGEDVIVGTGEEQVALNRDACWCDAVALEEAVAEGRWTKALEVYGGEFLSGFHLAGSQPFQEWVEGRRDELRRMAADAATQLTEQEEEAGNYSEALEWGRRAMDLSPFDEAALRRVLGLFDRLGDRAGALQAYELFAHRLAEELDVEPSPETQALAEHIRDRSENRWEVPGQVQPRGPESHQGPPMRKRVGPWGGAFAVLVAIVAIAGAILRPRGAPFPKERIVVARFENLTGDSTLAPLGSIAADWITQGLAQTSLLNVVTAPSIVFSEAAVDEMADGLQGINRALALARETDAGILVWGTYQLIEDSLEFRLRAEHLPDGVLLGSVGPLRGHRDDPMPVLDALRQRAMGLLVSRLGARLHDWPFQLQHPPEYAAYLEFVAGLEQYRIVSVPRAIDYFDRAVEIDSTFTVARFFSFYARVRWSLYEEADSMAPEVERSLDRLPLAMRYQFERLRASLRGDLAAAYQAARRGLELAPDDWGVQALARAAMSLGRYREAVDLYSTLDPDGGVVRASPWSYWKCFQACLHFLGEHEREAELGREARERYPGDSYYHNLEIEALAAMGRLSEVQERLDEGLALHWFHGADIATAAYELWLHGHEESAEVVFERAIAWFEERPAREKETTYYRQWYAYTLYVAGRWEESASDFEALASENPDDYPWVGYPGTVAARRGQREEAQRISDRWQDLDAPFLLGRNTIWRARIAALLGEREEAVRLIKQALSEGYGHELLHRKGIDFESLRDYAPYQEVIRPQG